ncbi:hypothetical protein T12_3559 [Trichinella patagoniensis]|uniref:Uncharacterized protein n=1 Tax=Trichinella patagoniensis TaxID=990121 RepID=A0A0V1A8M8_9BILA|nr:hypothetical protein T12_3559 [Trichinella patagoniensis]
MQNPHIPILSIINSQVQLNVSYNADCWKLFGSEPGSLYLNAGYGAYCTMRKEWLSWRGNARVI